MKYPNPSSYDKHIKTRVDKTLGYVYFLDSEHPLSSRGGKVYYHRHVMSVKMGKWIDNSYQVHHIDENRCNNDPSNLEALSPTMHGRKHSNSIKSVKRCKNCTKKFITVDYNFCSVSCASAFRQVGGVHNKITPEELSILVWEIPATKIAKKIGCSDVMVSKLCKRWGISKPGRGYWMKNKN
jgi:hypothetical protein